MPISQSGGASNIGSTQIADGAIINDDINAAAAIDISKLAGVAAKGANSDITSLTGLTTKLSQAQGGNGVSVHKCGTATRDSSAGSGTQTIAHGVGAIPRIVRIKGGFDQTNSADFSETIYDGTTQASLHYAMSSSSNTAEEIGTTFRFSRDPDSAEYQEGVVTFDATNIYIAWTKAGSPTGTIYLIWEAY